MENRELVNVNTGIYDASFLQDYQSCHRYAYWRYCRGLQSKAKNIHLSFGDIMHQCLADHYRGKSHEEVIEKWRELSKELPDHDTKTPIKGEEVLLGYFENYPEEVFRVLDVEVSFSMPIGKWELRGVMDLPIEWDKAVYIMDHKTAKNTSPFFMKGFENSFQMSVYSLACMAHLGRCDGAVINALRIAKTPVSKTKSTSDYVRFIVSKTPKQLNILVDEIKMLIADFEFRLTMGKEFFYKNRGNCNMWGGCMYETLCNINDSDKVIEHNYKIETPGKRLANSEDD